MCGRAFGPHDVDELTARISVMGGPKRQVSRREDTREVAGEPPCLKKKRVRSPISVAKYETEGTADLRASVGRRGH